MQLLFILMRLGYQCTVITKLRYKNIAIWMVSGFMQTVAFHFLFEKTIISDILVKNLAKVKC